jgi:hypothetical protein
MSTPEALTIADVTASTPSTDDVHAAGGGGGAAEQADATAAAAQPLVDEPFTVQLDSVELDAPAVEQPLPAVGDYLVLHGSFGLGDQKSAGPGDLVSLTAAEAKLALENGTVKRI